MHAGQAGLLQGADVGVVVAFRVVAHRMVMLAVDIKALSCGALRDGYAPSSASCTNSVPVLNLVCSFSNSLQSEAEFSHLA